MIIKAITILNVFIDLHVFVFLCMYKLPGLTESLEVRGSNNCATGVCWRIILKRALLVIVVGSSLIPSVFLVFTVIRTVIHRSVCPGNAHPSLAGIFVMFGRLLLSQVNPNGGKTFTSVVPTLFLFLFSPPAAPSQCSPSWPPSVIGVEKGKSCPGANTCRTVTFTLELWMYLQHTLQSSCDSGSTTESACSAEAGLLPSTSTRVRP